MGKFNDNMNDFLEIAPVETAVVEYDEPPEVEAESLEADKDFDQDFKQVKGQLQEIADNGMNAIAKLSQIADEGEHPRAFEVLAGLLKNTAEISKNVLDIHEQKRKFKGIEPAAVAQPGITVEKAVIVGTTAELLKSVNG